MTYRLGFRFALDKPSTTSRTAREEKGGRATASKRQPRAALMPWLTPAALEAFKEVPEVHGPQEYCKPW